MQKPRAEQTRRELIRLCHAGLDSWTLRIEILKRLKTVIPIDVSFFTTADPATLLFTGAVVDELESTTPRLEIWCRRPGANWSGANAIVKF